MEAQPIATLALSEPAFAEIAPEVPLLATPQPRFGALKAFGTLLLLLFGQILAGIGVFIAAVLVAVIAGVDIENSGFAAKLTSLVKGPLLLASAMASAAVALLLARWWAWDIVVDSGRDGIGIRRTPIRTLLVSFGAGIALSAIFRMVAALVPYDATSPLGPLAAAATEGGETRFAWALLALLFAPIVEEFLFRGLLLKGFTTSWGILPGAIVTTVLFVGMHLFETIHYWPATAAIASLAVGTLAARLVTKALAAAVVLHAGYNLAIVLAVYLTP